MRGSRRETIAAVDRSSGSRFKRNLRDAAALTARRFEQLAAPGIGATPALATRALSRSATIIAAAWLVREAFARKKLLLARAENKLPSAVGAV